MESSKRETQRTTLAIHYRLGPLLTTLQRIDLDRLYHSLVATNI
jgi:hypothetical protein